MNTKKRLSILVVVTGIFSVSLFAEGSAVDRLVTRLSKDPLSSNGLWVRIKLPADSKPEQVVEEYLKVRSREKSEVAYEVVEIQAVKIPNWPDRVYFAARTLTESKDLILLFRPSGTAAWGVRAYASE